MKYIYTLLGLSLIIGCVNKKQSFTNTDVSRFNFDAIYEYWKVVDTLKNNQYPSEKLWDKLLSHQGYKVIESANGTKPEMIKKRLITCFHPEFKQAKDSLIEFGDVFQKSTYLHLAETDRLRMDLEKHIDWLKNQKVYETMVDKTNSFLPEEYKNYKVPVINMVLFGENAHANNSGICMDLLLSFFADKIDKGGTLGHELHHYVLDSYKIDDKKAKEINAIHDKTKKLVQKLVYQCQKEGIANLIDKEKGYLNPQMNTASPDYLKLVRSEFAKGEIRVSQLNEKLMIIAQNKNKPYSWDFVNEAIPFYGHVVGFHMARVINKNGYHQELVNTIHRPQCFFELYNKAVREKQLDTPLFDETVIQLINEINQLENDGCSFN